MHTFGSVGGAGGDGAGEARLILLWAGLQPVWLLLFRSSGLSGTGGGLGFGVGDTLLVVSTVGVFSLGVSTVTEGGDKRRESEFRFLTSPSTAAKVTCLSPGSTFPLAEWMLSTSPRMHSGW